MLHWDPRGEGGGGISFSSNIFGISVINADIGDRHLYYDFGKSGNASCKVGKHLGSQRDPLPTVW